MIPQTSGGTPTNSGLVVPNMENLIEGAGLGEGQEPTSGSFLFYGGSGKTNPIDVSKELLKR